MRCRAVTHHQDGKDSAEEDGQGPFDDEEPPPSRQPRCPLHAVQDTGGNETAETVPDLLADEPGGQPYVPPSS